MQVLIDENGLSDKLDTKKELFDCLHIYVYDIYTQEKITLIKVYIIIITQKIVCKNHAFIFKYFFLLYFINILFKNLI